MRLQFRGGIYSSPEVCGCGWCPGGYGIRPYAVGDDACIGSEGLRLPRVPGGQTQRTIPSRLKKRANYPRMPLFLIACTASPIFSTGIVRAKRT